MNRMHFFLTLMCIGLAGSTAQWFMYRTAYSFLRPFWTVILFFIPILAFIGVNVNPTALPLVLTRFLAWLGGLSFAFFYYSVLLLLVFLLALLAGKVTGTNPAPQVSRYGFWLILLLLVAGAWRATHPVVREESFITAKAGANPYKIVFVSDLHLGGLFGSSYANELVAKINAQKPELILLGGDLIDGSLELVEKEGSYQAFKNLQATDGVYAVNGNHDIFGGSNAQERALLTKQGITFLTNQTQSIGAKIVLNGLDDYSRGGKIFLSPALAKQQLNIFLEHQPRHIEQAAAAGYDLYFAGHTHAGQFYPNRLITKRMYTLDYGSKYFAQMLATVSAGYGLWGIPIRIGPAPEIVVVNVEGKQ